jgi:hypothetical protein
LKQKTRAQRVSLDPGAREVQANVSDRHETQTLGQAQAAHEAERQKQSHDPTWLQAHLRTPEPIPARLYGSLDAAKVRIEPRDPATKQADLTRELVFVCDGAAWIWNLITTHYSKAGQIVDWYHAADRLHRVAHAAFGQEEARERWLDRTTTDLWEGRVAEVIHACAELEARCAEAHDAETYFTNNQTRMRYPEYREASNLIGSGTIESCRKQIVSQRLKCSGAQWLVPGAVDTAKARASGAVERRLDTSVHALGGLAAGNLTPFACTLERGFLVRLCRCGHVATSAFAWAACIGRIESSDHKCYGGLM